MWKRSRLAKNVLISAKDPLTWALEGAPMAKLKLRYYPDQVLKLKAKKVTHFDASVRKLVQDMFDTMYDSNGVGLAAPQVGVSKQIFIIDVSNEDDPRKPMVFINPTIVKKDGELVGLEGCLSFPDVFFEVKRFADITVHYQDLSGRQMKLNASGNLLCRAVQHELDHLNGELFIDKAVSKLAADLELTKHGFTREDDDAGEVQADDGARLNLSKDAVSISSGKANKTKESQASRPLVG
jgi:peptide deformylase